MKRVVSILILISMSLKAQESSINTNRQIWNPQMQAEQEEFFRHANIELQEAQKKGSQAVYEGRLKWTQKWAEQVQKTKNLDQILIFEQLAKNALEAWAVNWESEYDKKANGRDTEEMSAKKKQELEKAKKQEMIYLESLINYPTYLVALTDPSTVAPLEKQSTSRRTANNLLLGCVYYLAQAKIQGQDVAELIDKVNRENGILDKPEGEILKNSLITNVNQAEQLGILNAEGLILLKQWECPSISLGENTGEKVTPVPVLLSKEVENKIYNYELKPESRASVRMATLTSQERAFAEALNRAGLLSDSENARIQHGAGLRRRPNPQSSTNPQQNP
jgi:hypothetical protein